MSDMTNLLVETQDAMARAGQNADTINYIGSRDGYSCTWEEFVRLADFTYDSGYGGAEIPGDLEIHFQDGGALTRGEYDGSEWWEYTAPFTPPAERKQIRQLHRGASYWSSLAEIHVALDEES